MMARINRQSSHNKKAYQHLKEDYKKHWTKNQNDPHAHCGLILGFLAYLVVHELQLFNFLERGYSSNTAGDGPMTGLSIHGNRLKKNRPSMRRNPETGLAMGTDSAVICARGPSNIYTSLILCARCFAY